MTSRASMYSSAINCTDNSDGISLKSRAIKRWLYCKGVTQSEMAKVMDLPKHEFRRRLYKHIKFDQSRIAKLIRFMGTRAAIEVIWFPTISEKARNQDNPYDWGEFEDLRSYMPSEKMTLPGYFDGREGAIGIYPVPKDVRKVDVYYMKKPKMITSEDDYIELDDNYIDLVKYNVMSIIAMSGHNPDIEIANEYILLYNNLVQKANENKNEQQQRYFVIRDLYRKRRRR